MSRPAIAVIGMGAAGPPTLDAESRALVENATVLVGGRRHLAFFPEHPATKLTIGANVEGLLDQIAELLESIPLSSGRESGSARVVVLASGDPCCFGIGPLVVKRFGRDRVAIRPGVGSVPLLFNRLGRDWHDVRVLSAHGRAIAPVIAGVATAPAAAILTDDCHTPGVISGALLAAGLGPETPVAVGEQLGGPAERLTETTLGDLPGRSFDRLCVLAVFRDTVPAAAPVFGRPDYAYAHRAGMITKTEIRSVTLGLLQLSRSARVWDIGAGCGSLAIEAAGLAPEGTVWAIESDATQVEFLRENCRRFPAHNLQIVAGAAPDVLPSLTDPDAVFIGGSGGQLAAILAVCRARVRPGGRVVANFALLEHSAEALAFWQTAGWPVEVVQINAARGIALAGGTRLAALNPVTIVAATRPEGGND